MQWVTFNDQEEGQGMVEYGLLLVLISVAAVATVVLLGAEVLAAYDYAWEQISGALGG